MKTILQLASICLLASFISFSGIYAQSENFETRLSQYEEKVKEFNLEIQKFRQKVDSLSRISGKKEIEETIITGKGDTTKTRKTITLKDDRPGKEMTIVIHDAEELTKEQEKEILENLQSLKGLESLGSLSNLFQQGNREALSEPANRSALEKLSDQVNRFELKLQDELNELTDKMADLEMENLELHQSIAQDTSFIRLGTSKIIIIEDEKGKSNSIQWKKENEDKTEPEVEKKKEVVEFSTLGLSLGLNTFMHNGNPNLPLKYSNLELEPLRSWNVNLKLVEAKISLINHQLNLLMGVGVDWNNYRFRENISLSPRTDTLMIRMDTINFTKNKLMTQNLMGHMMLQFETKPGENGRTFDIGAGVFAGYLLNARTKQVSDLRGKNKFEDDFQLNGFRYGICGRIGYGAFDLYINYTLNDIFRTDLGPSVQNLSFGLNFTGL